MSQTKIIPAIDLIGGKCVRLEKGDYGKKKVYNEDPVEVAKEFEAAGIKYLHLVDLDGAKAGKPVNLTILEKISSQTALEVDFGGGIKAKEDLEAAFNAGAKQINVGSAAAKEPQKFHSWLKEYQNDRIILSADVREEKIAIHGWQTQTAIDLYDFVSENLKAGIQTAVVTDISKDGMLEGPAIPLYKKLMKQFPALNLVASGGVSGKEDVEELRQMNIYGIIIGKAIYEGKIKLEELIES
ncbi:MAG: 1-(5-phosphoribosyl)-5-[(5-phosphoribosylamino)methylideneamino]imidazole-4-carboxamide isomerase [Bacteroidota bacterium]